MKFYPPTLSESFQYPLVHSHPRGLKKRWGQALKPGAETQLDVGSLEAIAGEAPSASFPRQEVVGVPLASLVAAAGLQPSKAAVRRLIKVPSLPAGLPSSPLLSPSFTWLASSPLFPLSYTVQACFTFFSPLLYMASLFTPVLPLHHTANLFTPVPPFNHTAGLFTLLSLSITWASLSASLFLSPAVTPRLNFCGLGFGPCLTWCDSLDLCLLRARVLLC